MPLLPGVIHINAPIVIPPAGILSGPAGSWANIGGQGTPAPPALIIKPTASFVGAAAIIVQDQTLGGYGSQTTATQVRHLVLDGSAAPAGTDGILYHGPTWGSVIDDVCIRSFPHNGITTQGDNANYPSGQSAPYGFHVSRLKVDTCGNAGIVLGDTTDSQWHMVQVIGCGQNGWNFNSSGDHRLIDCSAEFCTIGFNCNAGISLSMEGCRTDGNSSHGISFNSVGGAGTGTPVASVSGCRFNRDGSDGVSFGMNFNNPGYPILVSDTRVTPDASFPATAINITGAGLQLVSLSNVLAWGAAAAIANTAPAGTFSYRSVFTKVGAGAIAFVADTA